MEHIDSICSLESSLFFHSICSLQILSSSRDKTRIKETINVQSNYTIGGPVQAVKEPLHHTVRVVAQVVVAEDPMSGNF